jgi:hypothetical protein
MVCFVISVSNTEVEAQRAYPKKVVCIDSFIDNNEKHYPRLLEVALRFKVTQPCNFENESNRFRTDSERFGLSKSTVDSCHHSKVPTAPVATCCAQKYPLSVPETKQES